MKKIFYLIYILTSVLIFSSCEKDSLKNADTLGYGSSFGMAPGYYINNLTISDQKVTFSKSKNGPAPDTKTCTSTLSASEVKALKDLMEDSNISAFPKRIGCPDCADGGAEWVSVISGSKEYKVIFEYGNAPKELKALVAKLRELKETFSACN